MSRILIVEDDPAMSVALRDGFDSGVPGELTQGRRLR